MTITLTPLTDRFTARVQGVDLTAALDARTFATLRRALDDHSVLVFPDQPMNDEKQIAFSGQWGPLEPTKGANPAKGTPFARQSKLDINTGTIIPIRDRRMEYHKGNYQWHADSTLKTQPSLCSILAAREVPPEGGNTRSVLHGATPYDSARYRRQMQRTTIGNPDILTAPAYERVHTLAVSPV